jgi:hypothetical protein
MMAFSFLPSVAHADGAADNAPDKVRPIRPKGIVLANADRVDLASGAGFSETADFLRMFQNEAVQPSWYEQKLWHLYDCTDYALNLFNCPTTEFRCH